jgi:hypothetical protein
MRRQGDKPAGVGAPARVARSGDHYAAQPFFRGYRRF